MRDSTLMLLATLVAVSGLLILFFVAPSEDAPYELEGTVVAVRGTHVTVLANVSVVARYVRVGESFRSGVFWAEDHFVALRPT